MSKKKKPELVKDEPKCLTEAEMLKMEIGNLQNELLDIKTHVVQQKIETQRVQKQLYQATARNCELMETILAHEKERSLQNHQDQSGKHKVMVAEIKEKYGIEGEKWGYHPDTGEIILS